MTAEIPLTEDQKAKIGEVVRKLNKKGAFLTASVWGDTLRVSGSREDIEALKSKLKL